MKVLNVMLLVAATLWLLGCSTDDSNPMSETGDQEIANNTEDLEDADTCTTGTSVFTINLDPTSCAVDIQTQLGTNSTYSETLDNTTRNITINSVADHLVGNFPNSGNPNTIAVVTESYAMTTTPQLADQITTGQGYTTGVLFSGVAIEPYTAEFFVGSDGTINMEWNITTLQSTISLGLDCNNAHVQPTGRYHYHGTPSNYLESLNVDGSQMVKVGYAADGFPMYYKYGYASDGISIAPMESGYQLKTAPRGGNGITAPDGCPDGFYFQDYEYVEGLSPLDECNGRFGKTPESDDEYYYVITDNFPSMPLCFSGTPNASFNFRN